MTGAFTNYHNKQQTYFDYFKHKGIVGPVLFRPQLNTLEKAAAVKYPTKFQSLGDLVPFLVAKMLHLKKYQTRGDLVPFLVGKC